MRKQFLNFKATISKRKINKKFTVASWKLLANSKCCSMQKPHELHLSSFSSTTLVDFSLCFLLLVDFLQCTLHSQLPTQFYESQAASCKHSHGQIDAVGPLKRVTTSIFKTNK